MVRQAAVSLTILLLPSYSYHPTLTNGSAGGSGALCDGDYELELSLHEHSGLDAPALKTQTETAHDEFVEGVVLTSEKA